MINYLIIPTNMAIEYDNNLRLYLPLAARLTKSAWKSLPVI